MFGAFDALVPEVGIEPTLQWNTSLSRARLPVPPLRHLMECESKHQFLIAQIIRTLIFRLFLKILFYIYAFIPIILYFRPLLNKLNLIMRINKKLLAIFISSLISLSSYSQSLSKLSDEELETKKTEAIAKEDFELAKQIKIEQTSRKSIDDKLAEKNEALKTALANEDYAKAELLKKEIKKLEADKATYITLEEDRKIAIFQENYDQVMAIEQKMNTLRTGKQPKATPPTTVLPTTSETPNNLILAEIYGTNSTAKSNSTGSLKKSTVPLSKYSFNEKTIANIGYGINAENSYDYSSPNYSPGGVVFDFNANAWWINKYLVGGIFETFGIIDGGLNLSIGGQMTALAEFDAIILPYTSLGFGFGINGYEEEFYTPLVYKLGTYIFVKKNRGFGFYTEFNIDLMNEYLPKWRFGVAWSGVKRKYRR